MRIGKLSTYDKSLQKTMALRSKVVPDLRALFDHLLALSADSHKRGYFKRAGIELAHARKLAK